jgi:hypothetical protein
LLCTTGEFGINPPAGIVQALALQFAEHIRIFRRNALRRPIKRLDGTHIGDAELAPDFHPRQPTQEQLQDLPLALSRGDAGLG